MPIYSMTSMPASCNGLGGGDEVHAATSKQLVYLVNEHMRRYDAANGTCTALANVHAICEDASQCGEEARLKFLRAACLSGGQEVQQLVGGFGGLDGLAGGLDGLAGGARTPAEIRKAMNRRVHDSVSSGAKQSASGARSRSKEKAVGGIERHGDNTTEAHTSGVAASDWPPGHVERGRDGVLYKVSVDRDGARYWTPASTAHARYAFDSAKGRAAWPYARHPERSSWANFGIADPCRTQKSRFLPCDLQTKVCLYVKNQRDFDAATTSAAKSEIQRKAAADGAPAGNPCSAPCIDPCSAPCIDPCSARRFDPCSAPCFDPCFNPCGSRLGVGVTIKPSSPCCEKTERITTSMTKMVGETAHAIYDQPAGTIAIQYDGKGRGRFRRVIDETNRHDAKNTVAYAGDMYRGKLRKEDTSEVVFADGCGYMVLDEHTFIIGTWKCSEHNEKERVIVGVCVQEVKDGNTNAMRVTGGTFHGDTWNPAPTVQPVVYLVNSRGVQCESAGLCGAAKAACDAGRRCGGAVVIDSGLISPEDIEFTVSSPDGVGTLTAIHRHSKQGVRVSMVMRSTIWGNTLDLVPVVTCGLFAATDQTSDGPGWQLDKGWSASSDGKAVFTSGGKTAGVYIGDTVAGLPHAYGTFFLKDVNTTKVGDDTMPNTMTTRAGLFSAGQFSAGWQQVCVPKFVEEKKEAYVKAQEALKTAQEKVNDADENSKTKANESLAIMQKAKDDAGKQYMPEASSCTDDYGIFSDDIKLLTGQKETDVTFALYTVIESAKERSVFVTKNTAEQILQQNKTPARTTQPAAEPGEPQTTWSILKKYAQQFATAFAGIGFVSAIVGSATYYLFTAAAAAWGALTAVAISGAVLLTAGIALAGTWLFNNSDIVAKLQLIGKTISEPILGRHGTIGRVIAGGAQSSKSIKSKATNKGTGVRADFDANLDDRIAEERRRTELVDPELNRMQRVLFTSGAALVRTKEPSIDFVRALLLVHVRACAFLRWKAMSSDPRVRQQALYVGLLLCALCKYVVESCKRSKCKRMRMFRPMANTAAQVYECVREYIEKVVQSTARVVADAGYASQGSMPPEVREFLDYLTEVKL